jgi:dihydrofolate reductase
MPLLRASLAVSLDGFIAARDGGVAWMHDYFSPEIDFGGFMKTIGATVFGRTTFDEALGRMHIGKREKDNQVVVLTHRPIPKAPPGVEAFSGDVHELAARLKRDLEGTGKDVWLIGGGLSIASFHEAGLVDRWELAIIPVLLGDGVPLFPRHSRGREDLRVTRSRTLKNGIIETWYEPIRDRAPRAPAKKRKRKS